MMFELKNLSGWSYYSLPEIEEKGIAHGFFTKDSPSAAFTGDDKTVFLKAFALRDIIVMDQEHGDEVHVIENGERPVKGDGIILIERGVAAIIKTADCLPVLLVETHRPMAAIVHAGWRGTAQRITQKVVQKMVALGAQREKITALLGPSIRSCCYEVGEEVRSVFRREGFSDGIFLQKNKGIALDLVRANGELLTAEGVEGIYDIGQCTFCRNDTFASYRRGERSKRQINFVSLRG